MPFQFSESDFGGIKDYVYIIPFRSYLLPEATHWIEITQTVIALLPFNLTRAPQCPLEALEASKLAICVVSVRIRDSLQVQLHLPRLKSILHDVERIVVRLVSTLHILKMVFLISQVRKIGKMDSVVT